MLRPLQITLTQVKIEERNIQRERSSAFSKLVNIENKDTALNVESRNFNVVPNNAKNTTISKALKERKQLRNEKESIERKIINLSLDSNKIKYKKDSLLSSIQSKKSNIESLEYEKKEELHSELSIIQLMKPCDTETNAQKNSNNITALEIKNSILSESSMDSETSLISAHIYQGVQNECTPQNVKMHSSEVTTNFDTVLEKKNSDLEVLHISIPEQDSHLKIATTHTGVSVEVKHDGLHEKEKRTLEEAIEEILKNQGIKTKKVKVTS